MKKSRMISQVTLIFLAATFVGQVAAAQKSKKSATQKRSHLSTDVRFSGTDVSGKYQSPAEAVTTVENEKRMLNLIEPRYEFTDRLRKSVSQR